jgi:hypothetical protein
MLDDPMRNRGSRSAWPSGRRWAWPGGCRPHGLAQTTAYKDEFNTDLVDFLKS